VKESKSNANVLLDALAAASEEDLTALGERIAGLAKELDALRQVEKIVHRRLHGAPAARRGGGPGRLADRIRAEIAENGPATIDDLAATLAAKPQAIRMAMQRAGSFVQTSGNRYAAKLPATK
jgi:thioredoxin-like negative regulator of GroEL